MSVANPSQQYEEVERTNPLWCSHFESTQRQRMLKDDSTALGQVSMLLMSIIALGFLLIGGTTVMILLTR